jgi:SAM-dependent methyltransferase
MDEPAQLREMERFWDARAREDPYYFVDSRLRYRDPDTELFWAHGESDLDALLAAVEARVEPSQVVVEIGCGVGRLTRPLADRASVVVALDVSSEMLARARQLNPHLDNVRWVHGDGRSLTGIGDASADLCVSHVVFQHIPDPEITLGYVREMGRVLRPGGEAVFGVSNDPAVHRRSAGAPRNLIARILGHGPRGQADPAWLGSSVDLADLRAAATEAGLEINRIAREQTQFCVVRARRLAGHEGAARA